MKKILFLLLIGWLVNCANSKKHGSKASSQQLYSASSLRLTIAKDILDITNKSLAQDTSETIFNLRLKILSQHTPESLAAVLENPIFNEIKNENQGSLYVISNSLDESLEETASNAGLTDDQTTAITIGSVGGALAIVAAGAFYVNSSRCADIKEEAKDIQKKIVEFEAKINASESYNSSVSASSSSSNSSKGSERSFSSVVWQAEEIKSNVDKYNTKAKSIRNKKFASSMVAAFAIALIGSSVGETATLTDNENLSAITLMQLAQQFNRLPPAGDKPSFGLTSSCPTVQSIDPKAAKYEDIDIANLHRVNRFRNHEKDIDRRAQEIRKVVGDDMILPPDQTSETTLRLLTSLRNAEMTKLGEGALGVAYRVKVNGKNYVLKETKQKDPAYLAQEIAANEMAPKHIGITPYFGTVKIKGVPHMVFESGDRDVANRIRLLLKTTVGQKVIEKVYTNQKIVNLAKGIQALHGKGVLHGDIKLQNILYFPKGNDFEMKIADLGGATNGGGGKFMFTPGISAGPEGIFFACCRNKTTNEIENFLVNIRNYRLREDEKLVSKALTRLSPSKNLNQQAVDIRNLFQGRHPIDPFAIDVYGLGYAIKELRPALFSEIDLTPKRLAEKKFIESMISPDPRKRPNIDKVVDFFST